MLAGTNPRVRFWNERLILIAQDEAAVKWVSFPVGDTVSLVAQGGDVLTLVRTATGDLGLSIVRTGQLIFALGAVAEVPLGTNVEAANDIESGGDQEAWLEVWAGSSRCRLRSREAARVGPYEVYVERTCTWHNDTDGVSECASIVRAADSRTANAAMRSAVLLAHERLDVLQGETRDGRFIRPTRVR